MGVVPWMFSVEALVRKRGVPDRRDELVGRRYSLVLVGFCMFGGSVFVSRVI